MKSKKILLALLLVLTLMLSLLPATALAAPGGKNHGQDPQEAQASEPEDAEAAEDAEEADAAAAVEDEEAEAEDAAEDADTEEAPAEEPTQAALVQAPGDEEEADLEALTVETEETVFATPGTVVYNNGGTVYNNGSTVYNNGGTVYNNAGLVYNNAGTVYSNGGTVYNNGGTVYNNGAEVYSFAGDVEDAVIYGYFHVTLADDYSAFADIEGLEVESGTDELIIGQDTVVTVTPKAGYRITDIQASAGTLAETEDGGYTLTEVDADMQLSMSFQVDAPVFSLEPGTYAGEQSVEITAADGAEILYSIDGSTPDAETGLSYEGPVKVSEGTVLIAVAVAEGAEDSLPAQAAYAVPGFTAPKFEAVEEGYDRPDALAIVVDNPGSAPAVITAVSIDTEDSVFTLSRSKGGTVAAGETDETSWTVRPNAGLEKGGYSAVVTFTLDSGDTVDVKLSFRVK